MKKFVSIFHANLNYAFLVPQNYERVIRASYEVIIDTFVKKHPDQKFVFETSGYTIDQMAKVTPDVLEKLKAAISSGQCEFMGAPYAHPIMANIPEEDGRWSVEFSQRTYEKHLGFRAESFWNPECCWMQYVPRAFRDAGAKYLTLDFESYMNCNDKEYAWVEHNRMHDIYWGGHLPWYDLDPNCPALHRPFKDVVPGLDGLCRSDRLIGKYLGYFRDKVTLDELVENAEYWSGDDEEGATVIIADDAEYCGTTGYYYVKYHRDYSRSFDIEPSAPDKLDKLISGIKEVGNMITFSEACQAKPVDNPFFVEDRYAWHRTYADAWGNTPEARKWDPILEGVRRDYKNNVQPIVEGEKAEEFKEDVEKFWFHLTCAANSDGRWPPPPAETCEFNRQWVLTEIQATQDALAALKKRVEGMELPPSTARTVDEIPDWDYNFDFTEKDPTEVEKLNLYELSHAIYYFHKMVDSKDPEKKAHGLKHLPRVFDELDRRGVTGHRPPSIS
jgi:hypothetical protein